MWIGESMLNKLLSYRSSLNTSVSYYYIKGVKNESFNNKVSKYLKDSNTSDKIGIKLLNKDKSGWVERDKLTKIKLSGMGTIIASSDVSTNPIGSVYIRSCIAIVLTAGNKACIIHIPNYISNNLLVEVSQIKTIKIISYVFKIISEKFNEEWEKATILGGIKNITTKDLAIGHVKRAYQSSSIDLEKFSKMSVKEVISVQSNKQLRTDFPELELEDLVEKTEKELQSMSLIYKQQTHIPFLLKNIIEKFKIGKVEIKDEYTNKTNPETEESLSVFTVGNGDIIIEKEYGDTEKNAHITLSENDKRNIVFKFDDSEIITLEIDE